MGTRAPTELRRATAWIALVGAGFAFAGSSTAWASTTPVAPVTCGTPAHAALYRTVQHDAVPAVTHEVKVIDQSYVPGVPATKEVSHEELTTVVGEGTPAGDGWTRTGITWTIEDTATWTEYQWQRKVIDQPAVPGTPAVPPVTHEETVVVTPASDEKVVDSEEWTEYAAGSWWNWSPNKDQGPFDGPPSFPDDERGTWQGPHENGGPIPDEPGTYNVSNDNSGNASWFHRGPRIEVVHAEESHWVHHDAVTRTETVVDVPGTPAVPGTDEVSHPETLWTRSEDTAPEGDGWSLTGEQRTHSSTTTYTRYEWTRTVVDVPSSPAIPEIPEISHVVVVVDVEAVPAWTEQVLVVKAVPAGQPCTAVTTAASPTDTPESLAQTGLDLTLPLGAGLAMVFAGGVLVAVRRVGSA